MSDKEKSSIVEALGGIRSYFPAQVDLLLSHASDEVEHEIKEEIRLKILQSNQKPDPLAEIYAKGLQVGVPLLFRQVPAFREVFSKATGMARESAEGDKSIGSLGVELVKLDIIRQIGLGLANVEKGDGDV